MFPIAVNLIVAISSKWIYTLMVYPFVMVMVLPITIWETWKTANNSKIRSIDLLVKLITVIFLVTIVCNVYYADFNYTALYYANRQTENYVSSLVVQVRMTEGFDAEKKWALIGTIEDPLLDNAWQISKPYVKFGGNSDSKQLLSVYSMEKWIKAYVGYNIPKASNSEIEVLKETNEFQMMPCWPTEGSIRVIGDLVVVKLQES